MFTKRLGQRQQAVETEILPRVKISLGVRGRDSPQVDHTPGHVVSGEQFFNQGRIVTWLSRIYFVLSGGDTTKLLSRSHDYHFLPFSSQCLSQLRPNLAVVKKQQP